MPSPLAPTAAPVYYSVPAPVTPSSRPTAAKPHVMLALALLLCGVALSLMWPPVADSSFLFSQPPAVRLAPGPAAAHRLHPPPPPAGTTGGQPRPQSAAGSHPSGPSTSAVDSLTLSPLRGQRSSPLPLPLVATAALVGLGAAVRLAWPRRTVSQCPRLRTALCATREHVDLDTPGQKSIANLPPLELVMPEAVDGPQFPYLSEEDIEELEILPVGDEEYRDEAFIVDYHCERLGTPLLRPLKSRHACEMVAAMPSTPGILRWVNVVGNQDSLTLPLLTAFRVHPLFVEDILHDAERSKVENLGSNQLVVLFQAVQLVEEPGDGPGECPPLLRLEMNQVSLVLQDRVLLSFFNSPSKTVEQCKACIALSGSKLRTSSPHWLVHLIMDKEVDRLYPIMNRFRAQLEEVQQLLEKNRPRGLMATPNADNLKILQVLHTTSQEMNNLIFVLRPLASTVAALTEYTKQHGMTELQWHFDDLRDHIATILDYVASMQTWVKCLKDDYSFIQQDNMNRTMYTLTLITALFVPAQFLTGLFGMNFQYMPWLNWEYGFPAFWGVVLTVASLSVLMFKRIRWL